MASLDMKTPRYCKTCGTTTWYRLHSNRDAWTCMWDRTVTTGIDLHEAIKAGEWPAPA